MVKQCIIIPVILAFILPASSVARVTDEIPDTWIVFTSNRYGNDDIFLLDTSDGSLRRLTNDPATDHRPAISADGSMVIFVSERGGQPDLYLIHLDGTGNPIGSVDQLTDTPWEEFDTTWRGNTHSYMFTAFRPPDTDAIELFYGSDTPDIEGEWDIFSHNPHMDSIDRLSLEPGDYRYPVYTESYATVYTRRNWEDPEDTYSSLGYFHGALANRTFDFSHGSINGPIRNSSLGMLFIPCTDGEDNYYIFYDTMHGRISDSVYAGENPLINVTPQHFDESGGWFLGQTAPEGDCASEVSLFKDPGSQDPLIINLTSNDCYDGEPCWIARPGRSSVLEPYAIIPGDIPPLPEPVELEVEAVQPFPATTMVPGMLAVSAGGSVPVMSEPSESSEQIGELPAGESRSMIELIADEYGEIWYMISGPGDTYRGGWCRGSMLVPDLGHMTDTAFQAWLAAGLASSGQMSAARRLVERIDGIGIASEEDDDVLILVYNTANPPTRDWEELSDCQDSQFIFAGRSGFSCRSVVNLASVHSISPSGRYFAIGADGTGTWRGGVDLVDLETCVKYRYSVPHSGVGSCSDWINGDYLLIENLGPKPVDDPQAGVEDQPWINFSYRTDADGARRDVVLMHGTSAWLILPEEEYYNYRLRNSCGLYTRGVYFDVTASPNIIPSLAGIESYNGFTAWIDSMGGRMEAFPEFDFRVYVDTRNMRVNFRRIMETPSEPE